MDLPKAEDYLTLPFNDLMEIRRWLADLTVSSAEYNLHLRTLYLALRVYNLEQDLGQARINLAQRVESWPLRGEEHHGS